MAGKKETIAVLALFVIATLVTSAIAASEAVEVEAEAKPEGAASKATPTGGSSSGDLQTANSFYGGLGYGGYGGFYPGLYGGYYGYGGYPGFYGGYRGLLGYGYGYPGLGYGYGFYG